MGNAPSSTSQKPSPAAGSRPSRHEPKRRESLHALPSTTPKATPAPPSASLESAVGQSALAPLSPSQARDIAKPGRSRDRSASAVAPTTIGQGSKAMGNEPSKPTRVPSVSKKRTASGKSPSVASSAPIPVRSSGSRGQPSEPPSPAGLDPTASVDAYAAPASYSRPPRLPIPIEEELHTPGSPILAATDPGTEVPAVDGNTNVDLQRRASVISSNIDEDEEPDEFEGYMPDLDPSLPKVPTVIEWREAQPHDKVYVTGTFARWERKFRLHWTGPSKLPNTVSATLQLPPGTHHVKFLVNNTMEVASHLPTTVDYTNILVNYIEVASDKVAPIAPVAVPPPSASSRPLDIRTKQAADGPSPHRVASPAVKATSSPHASAKSSPHPAKSAPQPAPTTKRRPPRVYTNEIPQYLLDLDVWPPPSDSPDSSPETTSLAAKYRRANKVAATIPEPPSLPLFLNKSILNQATPMKDDSSVLVLPNHTVLNHLSTTNIKNGVLATSCTSRYKQRVSTAPGGTLGGGETPGETPADGGKFLTTILYKPRSDDD